METIEQIQKEIELYSQAGHCKSIEQIEAIEQEAYDRAVNDTLNDCKAGRYLDKGIFNRDHVLEMMDIRDKQVNEKWHQRLRNTQGVFVLPEDYLVLLQMSEDQKKAREGGAS